MPTTKYTKWIKTPLDGLSLEELMDELSEFFLQSGFNYGYSDYGNPDTLDSLKQAIIEKLVEIGRIPQSLLEQWLEDLNAPPLPRKAVDSDKVSQAEVDDEMTLFRQAQGVLT